MSKKWTMVSGQKKTYQIHISENCVLYGQMSYICARPDQKRHTAERFSGVPVEQLSDVPAERLNGVSVGRL